MILEPGVRASLGNLTETLILGTTLDLLNQKLQGGSQHFILTSPPGDFYQLYWGITDRS